MVCLRPLHQVIKQPGEGFNRDAQKGRQPFAGLSHEALERRPRH